MSKLLRLNVCSKIFLTTISILALGPTPSWADAYHYKNVLIGERAAGMAGAYTALSDDPAGGYYNPAGLAFSFENYISLSANAFSASSQRYKNVVNGQDYVMASSSFIPAFFGFTQTMGHGKFAFSIVVPNADIYDQQDELKEFTTTDNAANYLTRKFFRQDTTYLVGPSYAHELNSKMSVGGTLFAQARLGKSLDNQKVAYNPLFTGKYLFQDVYTSSNVYSLVAKVGFQYMPTPKVSLGLTVSRPFRLLGKIKIRQVATKTNTDGTPVTQNGSYDHDISSADSTFDLSAAEPLSISLGGAYFFSKRFLISSDFDYNGSDAAMNVATTLNGSIGTEWYVTDSFPIRLGLFTNNSNSLVVTGDYTGVNLLGVSTGFSFITPGSSFSMGVSYSKGTGQGQIVKNGPLLTLIQTQYTIFIMGSYQL